MNMLLNNKILYCTIVNNYTDAEDAQFLGLLVKHFKLSAFKDWQIKAIKATLKGRDTFINQPTGMCLTNLYRAGPDIGYLKVKNRAKAYYNACL